MSLSVKNGGIGKSPAISLINRSSPEKASKAITVKMRRVIEQTETRAISAMNKTWLEADRIWTPSASVSQKPHYPMVELNLNSLIAHISDKVGVISTKADCTHVSSGAKAD